MVAIAITPEQLKKIATHASIQKCTEITPYLNQCFVGADISTPLRAASLLGQVLLECGEFKYTEEIADGSAYEGRKDLGNIHPGDGKRYKGRGWIEITGLANYAAFFAATGIDIVAHPELASTLENCAKITAWYWTTRNMNVLAEKNDQRGITKKVNGKATDCKPSFFLRRMEYYDRALAVLTAQT
jgi:predicted chitinase